MSAILNLFTPWNLRSSYGDLVRSAFFPSSRTEPDGPEDEEEALHAELDPAVPDADVPVLPIVALQRAVPRLIDNRKVPRKKRPERGRGRGARALSDLDALMDHQTATLFSSDEQCLGVPSHSVIRRDGTLILNHDMLVYLWHGDGGNRNCYGIEVEARAAGAEGVAETVWLSKKEKAALKAGKLSSALDVVHEATPEQLETLAALHRYVPDEANRRRGLEGMPSIVFDGVGHRQAKRTKNSDPGSRIYRSAIESAQDIPSLEMNFTRTWSKGRNDKKAGAPAPDIWTGVANGVEYSWRYSGVIEKDAA